MSGGNSNPAIGADNDEWVAMEIDEEVIQGVMRWLEEEIGANPAGGAFYEEAGFVTINGNEESCGPSFSASASTVMASVHTGGGGAYFFGVPANTAIGVRTWGYVPAVGRWFSPAPEGGRDRDAGNEGESREEDDTWLARVIELPAFGEIVSDEIKQVENQ